MAARNPERSSHFPAIERKHGEPMSHWFDLLKELGDAKYAEQVAHLKEDYGFSQAHANAVVMYSRGNTSSKRYATYEEFLATLDSQKRKTVESIFAALLSIARGSEIVIAWNQPMIKRDGKYLFGVMVAKEHLLIAPWGGIPESVRKDLNGYEVQKKTIRIPVDWKVDKKLLKRLLTVAS